MVKINKGDKLVELKGEIKEFIFQNDINSYTIAILQTETEEITVVRIFTIYNNRRFFEIRREIYNSS